MGKEVMKAKTREFKSTDEYIRSFPERVQKKLQELRELVNEQAPEAQEKISYRMPAFFLNRNIVYFAAYAKHIGFYPGAGVIRAFKNKLSKYKNAKGSVQFPHEVPLSRQLIKQMVRFKVQENAQKKKH